MATEHPVFLTTKEVADRLRVHPDTVRRLIRSKKLPVVRLGAHTFRVREDALLAFEKGATGEEK